MPLSKILYCLFYYWFNRAGCTVAQCRVLDSRPRGHGFETHWHHCVVSLSKTHLSVLSTCSTQEDPSQHNWKIVDWDVKNQNKQTKSTIETSWHYWKNVDWETSTQTKIIKKMQIRVHNSFSYSHHSICYGYPKNTSHWHSSLSA